MAVWRSLIVRSAAARLSAFGASFMHVGLFVIFVFGTSTRLEASVRTNGPGLSATERLKGVEQHFGGSDACMVFMLCETYCSLN